MSPRPSNLQCGLPEQLPRYLQEMIERSLGTHLINGVSCLTSGAHRDIDRTKAGTPVRFVFRETGEELQVKRYLIHNKQVVVARIPRLRDLVIIKAHGEYGHHDYWYIWHGVFGWEAQPSVMRKLLQAEFADPTGPIGTEEMRGYHEYAICVLY